MEGEKEEKRGVLEMKEERKRGGFRDEGREEERGLSSTHKAPERPCTGAFQVNTRDTEQFVRR